MKKGVSLLLLVILGLALISCAKKSEKELYDLAGQYMVKEEWAKAEENFQKILQEYPNGVYSSKALFMVAFINANYLNNLEKARQYYQEFLEKYPNHELADDARYELENLGKSIDELPFLQSDEGEGVGGAGGEKTTNTQ